MFDEIDLLIISLITTDNSETTDDCIKMLTKFIDYKYSYDFCKKINTGMEVDVPVFKKKGEK